MRRSIAVSCLVVLVFGIGTLLYADSQKVIDPRCGSGEYTSADYHCSNCDGWYILPAWSDSTSPPPYDAECPYCPEAPLNPAECCGCSNPNCVGGVFWTR